MAGVPTIGDRIAFWPVVVMVEGFGRHTLSRGKHSRMAELVAISRAVHQLLDEDVVFDDPLAERILGAAAGRWMHENLEWQRVEGLRRTRVLVALRSRYAEELLLRAAGEGTAQYVTLGAGLDTFAYRGSELARKLMIYEVDQPATQDWKRERLAEADIAIPSNVRFVPVDFGERTLEDALAEAGFERSAPAFFSWLGVTYYLPREAVLETLEFIGSQRAAAEVFFDYAVDTATLPPQFRQIMSRVLEYIATTGEPWQTAFVPGELMAELRGMGFLQTTQLGADELAMRYLGRGDNLGPIVALITARTGVPG